MTFPARSRSTRHDGVHPKSPFGAGGDATTILRRLRVVISRRLDGLLHGDYLGLLPGAGSEAGESREYRPGDDVRRMDWPVTARTTVPHVRHTVADRELETWLAMDLSPSLDFGTARCEKRDLAIEVAVGIAQLTMHGGNRLGAVVTNGERQSQYPARPGRLAAQALLKRLLTTPRGSRGASSDLAALIDALSRPARRRGFVVVISDFLGDQEWSRPLRKLAVRHDVLAIEVVDPRELTLPAVGVLTLLDPETGAVHEVETSARFREKYARAAAAQRTRISDALRHAGVAHLRLRTDTDWLMDLVRYVTARRRGVARGTTR